MSGSREQQKKKDDARREAIQNTQDVCADGKKSNEYPAYLPLDKELNNE